MIWGSVLWLGFNAWPPALLMVTPMEAFLPAFALTCARWSVKLLRG